MKENIDELMNKAVKHEQERILDRLSGKPYKKDVEKIIQDKKFLCLWECYGARCTELVDKDFCKKHDKKCSSCGEEATHGCSFCGQFVCGSPLCDNCTYSTDRTKPSGNWGFLNHIHIKKEKACKKNT